MPTLPVFYLLVSCFISINTGEPAVLNQGEVGRNTCGPCALVNSLRGDRNGDALNAMEGDTDLDKAIWFTQTYGSFPSIVYNDDRESYNPNTGIADRDLKHLINRFMEESDQQVLTGSYVTRNDAASEEDAAFLDRIYSQIQGSIDAGFAPLLSIRALAAQENKDASRHVWNSLGGHWIAIHDVERVEGSTTSLLINFSDSLSGKRQTGFIFLNQHRRAVVPMAFTVDEDSNEQWDWISNTQTLELLAPDLPLGTTRAQWHERTFIAVRYLLYRSEHESDSESE